jgi:uncharacterized protein YjbI with pentapeptide repeats
MTTFLQQVKINLREANLGGAFLGGANLEFSNLNGANLERTDLSGANLNGTIFRHNNILNPNNR